LINLNSVTDTPNAFSYDASWDRPLAKIELCDVLVVVGPPNCGKSTYIGYLLNQLASKNINQTYYIEADCG